MSTPYLKDQALAATENEGIDEIVHIVDNKTGLPADLTGRTFKGQARYEKDVTSDLICDLNIEIYGPPTDGNLRIWVADPVIYTLATAVGVELPIKGFYDVLSKTAGGIKDNLYIAPFAITGGVTLWTI